MATYYVGSGGSDSNAGTSYATRFLTLGKAATTVSAGGDIVYVSPGTYREQLTVSVSGGNAYSTGTVTATNASTIVTGSGTLFVTGGVAAGDYFKTLGAGAILITSVDSETQLTLASAYDGPTSAGLTYSTFRPIHWIGDYSGANTDGVGGVVRITGSPDDISFSRTNGVTHAAQINYIRFSGFAFDICQYGFGLVSPTYWIIERCHFQTNFNAVSSYDISVTGASQSNVTVQNCYSSTKYSGAQGSCYYFSHSSTLNNTGHIVQNCIIEGANSADGGGINIERTGGVKVRNCFFRGCQSALTIRSALAAGQITTVNNCVITICTTGLKGTSTTEIQEDYNNFYNNGTNRTNTNTGANSVSYPPLLDTRWWFELTA